MENCFEERSRAIRGFSEPIQWTEKSINMFKPFIESADLYFYADQIWDFPKNEQKQKILKLLCSEILLDGKNIVISIRKPILELAKIGSCQIWQRKLYDLRKKYADELTELYPIVQSLENDPQVQKILKIN